jgi:hypothetical protein
MRSMASWVLWTATPGGRMSFAEMISASIRGKNRKGIQFPWMSPRMTSRTAMNPASVP